MVPFSSIRIILVNTSHPGNIGGVARAMKNMGLDSLVLVQPQEFPSSKAAARASGATDILDKARVVSSLAEAVSDCSFVIGTSARSRHIRWPLQNPREIANQILTEACHNQVALIFGTESSGLTNAELQQCHVHMHIPAVTSFSSINLAMAVQIIGYELRMSWLADQCDNSKQQQGIDKNIALATVSEIEHMFEHLQQTLVDIDFLNLENPKQLMVRLRRLYLRARLDKTEVNIMRGILTATQKLLKNRN